MLQVKTPDIFTTINGVKFTDGYLNYDAYGGAAIYAGPFGTVETLTINNCVFDNNICPTLGGSGGLGGAIYMFQGTLNIDGSTFTNNQSADGDGGAIIYLLFNFGDNGVISITNSTFTGNMAGANGGAIKFLSQGSPAAGQTFSVDINKNTFLTNTAAGYGGAISADNAMAVSTPLINYNRFVGNTSTLSATTSGLHFVESDGSVNAENNWWACNTGPTAAGTCNKAAGIGTPGAGILDANPWLQLKVTASPTTICNSIPSTPGNTSTVTASFLKNSDNTVIPVANLSSLIGLPVTWTSTLGTTGAPEQLFIQATGEATTTFTSNGTAGTATVNAQVDNIPASETSPARASITVNTSSTAPTGATGTTSICNGSSTTLTVSGGSKGSGATTEWFTGSCGGTPAGTGDAIIVSPTITTTYYVRYNGTCNTTTCATVTVTVNTLSTTPTGATGTTTICSGSSTTLTVDGGSKGTGAITEWFTGSCGGTLVFTGDAFIVSPTITTTYYVRYTGTCNTTTCATVTVTVNQLPTVNAPTVVQPTCATPTGTITVNASGSGTLEYSIDGGANWFITNVFSGLAPGSYNISVRSQSAPSCVSVYSGNPVILIAATNCCTPVDFGTVASGNQTICNGGDPSNITFSTAPSGGAAGGSFNYQWYYKDGVADPCPTGTSTSGWTLISGATGNSYDPPSGLTTSRTYAVTVDPTGTPDCGVATWANSCRKVTVGTAVVATCSNNNPVLYFGYPGDQTATVKTKATGGTAPYTISITMNRPLNCNVITSSGDELWTAASGTSVNNVCPVSGPGLLPPVSTGTGIASGVDYSVTVTLMQDAIFTATITDANGCISTCTTSIHAEDVRCFAGNSGNAKVKVCHQTGSNNNPCHSICVNESAVAAHLAHGDFIGNCTPDCVAPVYTRGAITEENPFSSDKIQVKVIPNPTDSYFTLDVESSSNEKIVVVVYDVLGRVVKHIGNSEGQLIRFGEDLKVGSYMAIVRQGNNTKTVKLVKQ
jgi:predicted outer membrane repeat protein